MLLSSVSPSSYYSNLWLQILMTVENYLIVRQRGEMGARTQRQPVHTVKKSKPR